MIAYVHLDCLDGKQARRTKSSSPLGQLFDHGCDALSVNLLLANIGVSLSMPCSWAHGLGNLGVMFTWILAQWEEYHTSIMLYGNSFYGVLEANYCIAALHLVTFAAGPQLWRTPATKLLPFEFLRGVRECPWPCLLLPLNPSLHHHCHALGRLAVVQRPPRRPAQTAATAARC